MPCCFIWPAVFGADPQLLHTLDCHKTLLLQHECMHHRRNISHNGVGDRPGGIKIGVPNHLSKNRDRNLPARQQQITNVMGDRPVLTSFVSDSGSYGDTSRETIRYRRNRQAVMLNI